MNECVVTLGGDTVLLDMRSPLENAERPCVVSTKDTTPSRWVWRHVTSALRVNDVERAHREKQLVEGEQRAVEVAVKEGRREAYRPVHFERVSKGNWVKR